MKITDFISMFLAGGLLGFAGQVIRMFIGIAKSNARGQDISISRLIGSLIIGLTSGGIGIFTLSKWQENYLLTEEHFFILLSIGYAGTDFLEGFFRTLILRGAKQHEDSNIEDQSKLAGNIVPKLVEFDNNTSLKTEVLPQEPVISYGENVNKNVISSHALEVVINILKESNNKSAKITSSARTPFDQARIMYNNVSPRRTTYSPPRSKGYGLSISRGGCHQYC